MLKIIFQQLKFYQDKYFIGILLQVLGAKLHVLYM